MIGFHVAIEIGKLNIRIINRRQKYLEKNWKYSHSKSNPDQFRIKVKVAKVKGKSMKIKDLKIPINLKQLKKYQNQQFPLPKK